MLKGSAIAAGRFHDREIASRDIQVSVHPEGQAVGGVICGAPLVVPAYSLHEHLYLFRDAVSIGINECGEVRRMDYVEAVVIPEEAARCIEVFDKLDRFICPPIAIRITEPDDSTAIRRCALRAVSIAGNIEIAVRSCGDKDWIIERWRDCEKIEIETLGNRNTFENFRFLLRRRLDHLRRRVSLFYERVCRLVVGLLVLRGERE